mgnify:CR=1 FL=1
MRFLKISLPRSIRSESWEIHKYVIRALLPLSKKKQHTNRCVLAAASLCWYSQQTAVSQCLKSRKVFKYTEKGKPWTEAPPASSHWALRSPAAAFLLSHILPSQRAHFCSFPFDSHWNACTFPLLSWAHICCFASKQECVLWSYAWLTQLRLKTKAVVLVIVTDRLAWLLTAGKTRTSESTLIMRQKKKGPWTPLIS